MKQFLRSMAFRLTRKRVREELLSPEQIEVDKGEVSWFCLSTNPILSFSRDGKCYYFRECPKFAGRDEFFRDAVEKFFFSIHNLGIPKAHFREELPIPLNFPEETVGAFRSYIQEKIADAGFRKRLFRADQIAREQGFSIWEPREYDDGFFESFGLADRPAGTDAIAVYFLWCMRSAAMTCRTLGIARGGEHSFFNAVRAVSSKIVADAIGLSHMITDARFCRLCIGGEITMLGVLSDAAPGSRMRDCTPQISGELQRELSNLYLLDLLLHQVDHGPNNYNLWNAGDGVRICAFDNDNPATFFPQMDIVSSLRGCAPLLDEAGGIRRPFLDRDLAGRILAVDQQKLRAALGPYLNAIQVFALITRLEKMQKAISDTVSRDPSRLLDRQSWSMETARQELEGSWGKTYFTQLFEKY